MDIKPFDSVSGQLREEADEYFSGLALLNKSRSNSSTPNRWKFRFARAEPETRTTKGLHSKIGASPDYAVAQPMLRVLHVYIMPKTLVASYIC